MADKDTPGSGHDPREMLKTALKAPGIFRRPLKEKKLNHLVKLLEQAEDQAFLRSCFTFEEGKTGEDGRQKPGRYLIRTGLGKAEVKRLKTLAKAIKINKKGPVKILPVMVLGILIAGGVFFFTVMLDPLLSRLLTQGLENVFEAKVDVRGFHLGLLRFRIGIASLTVANRDEPMKNLFETGRLEIRLKPQAVLRGKIYIEEIRADHLQFGTARTVSGALPQYAARIAARKNKPPAPPLIDLANFDAQGLLDREYDKLASPKAYNQAIAAYGEARSRWEARYASANARAAEVQEQGRPLLAVDTNSLKTPEAVGVFVADVNRFVKTLDGAREEINAIASGVEQDLSTARTLERTAREALEADLNHLKDYLDLGSGSALAALEPSIREILSDEAEGYIAYGRRALEALHKIKALQAYVPKSQGRPEKTVYRGRDVHFPTPDYPVFYLGLMASDFNLKDWNWAFELRSVSSDPDLSNRPTELDLGLSELGGAGRTGRFSGSADFRTNASTSFRALAAGDNFPLDIRNSLSQIGIGGFTGTTGFSVNFAGGRGGAVSAGGEVRVRNPALTSPEGTIALAVAEAMADFAAVELGIQYEHPASGADTFTLTSNLMDLIKDALKRAVDRYLRQAQAAIEKALRDRIEQYLAGKWVSREELDTIFAAVKGDRAAVDSLKANLEARRDEAERKLRSAADEAVNQAREEVRTQADAAARQALDNVRDRLPFGRN
ncbi:MAG: hypothetical protein LBD09_02775 [Treponema sp.]|jgi:uncharacterized protein (TIGR03545 family)|nr:hypothetical protein [Treponema sp.]